MSAILNDRDVLLQGAGQRITPAQDRVLLLAASANLIRVAHDGSAPAPAAVNFTALLLNMTGNVTWSAVPALDMTVDGNTAVIAASAFGSNQSVIVTAKIIKDGVTYEAKQTVVKVADGANGAAVYTWIKYADSVTGTGISDSPTGKAYIGLAYNKSTPIESDLPGDYTWSLFRGDQGPQGPQGQQGTQGVQGPMGPDGKPTYTWIAYSDSPNGANMYQVPTATTIYIGIATNKTTDVESSSPADYVWSKFKGDQGVQGPQGPQGAQGPRGYDGSDGGRGNIDIALSGYTSWSDTAAVNAVINAGYGYPQNRDRVTLYGSGYAETRFYNDGSWLTIAAWINGNMVVDGTFSANKISGGSITASTINIANGNFRVFSASGSMSAFKPTFTDAYAGNASDPYLPAMDVNGSVSSLTPALRVMCAGTGSAAHGLQSMNTNFGTSGIVGMAGPYDFYADGAGTNYGPFTGAHDGLVPNEQVPELGDLMIDVACVGQRGFSNALFTLERSNQPYQRGVRGPISGIVGPLQDFAPAALVEGRSYTEDAEGNPVQHDIMSGSYYDLAATHTLVAVNGVGEGSIKVCGQGGPISADDLLVTSSIPGVAMRQNVGQLDTAAADDLVRGYTVAKARVAKGEVLNFPSSDTVLVIPCIYLGG
jgi:hypothetical protein